MSLIKHIACKLLDLSTLDLFHPWSILSQRSAVWATDMADEDEAVEDGEADAAIGLLWHAAMEDGLEPTAEDNMISRDCLSEKSQIWECLGFCTADFWSINQLRE